MATTGVSRRSPGARSSTNVGAPTALQALARQFDYQWTVYKRTWRGGFINSFVSPLFYVAAMGVMLGGYIARDPARLEGAPSYLAFVVPGLVAAHAMQTATADTTWPVMGMIKWHRTYHAMLATPLQIRDVVAGHLCTTIARVALNCTVFMTVLIGFGVFATWWGWVLALLSQILVGACFAALTYAYAVRVEDETSFSNYFRLVVMPLMLFSGAFFPIANFGEVGAWVARLTPLWQGVNLSRMFCVDNVDWSVAAINVVVLVTLTAIGWVLGIRGLTRRLGDPT